MFGRVPLWIIHAGLSWMAKDTSLLILFHVRTCSKICSNRKNLTWYSDFINSRLTISLMEDRGVVVDQV
jgi:hypothetical protein